jgi:hypothetical protein
VLLHVHGMCIPYKALCMRIVWAVGIFKLKYRYRIRSIGRFDYRGGGGLLIVGTERSFLFHERVQQHRTACAPHELTHVRASPGDCVRLAWRKLHGEDLRALGSWQSSRYTALVARTARRLELHGDAAPGRRMQRRFSTNMLTVRDQDG